VLHFDGLALGSTTPVPFDRSAIDARIRQPFTRDYYARGGIDVSQLLAPYLDRAPRVYGPEFDRTALVNVNRDLFPRDEFAAAWDCRQPAVQAESTPNIQARPAARYEGYVETVSCDFISGWAWDAARSATPLTVDLYEGDRRLASSDAARFRPDLADARKGNGCHAFVTATPRAVRDGHPHSIRAVVKDSSFTLTPLAGASAPITCGR
jgi:hypothetical protein